MYGWYRLQNAMSLHVCEKTVYPATPARDKKKASVCQISLEVLEDNARQAGLQVRILCHKDESPVFL